MNKGFTKLAWNPDQCRQELASFRQLLGGPGVLKEKSEILLFFRTNLHLSAFIGSYDPDNTLFDLFAHEYPLWDFVCDLVVGDSITRRYVFIEFEDAAPNSLFAARKATPEWAPRFEHGFSQILDWFWKLHDMEKTDDFRDRFGADARYFGLLLVGRTENLTAEVSFRRRSAWTKSVSSASSQGRSLPGAFIGPQSLVVGMR